ncbi:MAG: hypothetical protein G01um101433_372 [Parcubacteria group bacterium Gr01-1014_33]|nr:MAG: hypothetical protein G01um101433_372 [Parcubacteria group bacterium Gr01-1014_33]
MKLISELRQDIVSGDWVVIARVRARRPHDFLGQKRVSFNQPKRTCPFETLAGDALLAYPVDGAGKKERWWVEVIPNKYPVFAKGICAVFNRAGIYQWTEGAGAHEVVVTKDHTRAFDAMSDEEVELVARAYQDRYTILKEDECAQYVSIFHNHGRLAGATIRHPHSQIIVLPVVPPDVGRSIKGSEEYFREHKKCVHCVMVKFEQEEKARVIYANERFIVIAPYASRSAFEIRIFPKAHSAHFEKMNGEERRGFAHALRIALAKIAQGLENPDYNFFLHTAPIKDEKKHSHYHWHLEIVPKTAIWAGFEIGTGIEISTIAPEDAAEFLRKIKV